MVDWSDNNFAADNSSRGVTVTMPSTLEEARVEIERLKVTLKLYADHNQWVEPAGTYSQQSQRYFVAQYEEPQGAGGWYAAEQALLNSRW